MIDSRSSTKLTVVGERESRDDRARGALVRAVGGEALRRAVVGAGADEAARGVARVRIVAASGAQRAASCATAAITACRADACRHGAVVCARD